VDNTEIFIHIGYHKTGTTFLQANVFPNLGLNFIRSPDVAYIAESNNFQPEKFIEILQSNNSDFQPRKTIISQEVLSGRAAGTVWDETLIADRLHQTFPKAKILIVIRNQFDYIFSLYAMRVIHRGRESQNLSRYLDKRFYPALKEKLDYSRLITKYHQLFGKEQVQVLLYEELNTNPDLFIDKVLDFIGVDIDLEFDKTPANKGIYASGIIMANRIINYPFEKILNKLLELELIEHPTYAKFSLKYFAYKKKFIQPLIFKIFSRTPTSQFPADWYDELHGIFSASNSSLQEILDIDLRSFGYPIKK